MIRGYVQKDTMLQLVGEYVSRVNCQRPLKRLYRILKNINKFNIANIGICLFAFIT